jgi:hypothetical protein
MTSVEFELTIPVFERAKTFYALDCVATVIGLVFIVFYKICGRVLNLSFWMKEFYV